MRDGAGAEDERDRIVAGAAGVARWSGARERMRSGRAVPPVEAEDVCGRSRAEWDGGRPVVPGIERVCRGDAHGRRLPRQVERPRRGAPAVAGGAVEIEGAGGTRRRRRGLPPGPRTVLAGVVLAGEPTDRPSVEGAVGSGARGPAWSTR